MSGDGILKEQPEESTRGTLRWNTIVEGEWGNGKQGLIGGESAKQGDESRKLDVTSGSQHGSKIAGGEQ